MRFFPLWTDCELEILTELYGTIKKRELAKLLPERTISGISGKAFDLGLKADRSITNRRLVFSGHDYFRNPNVENSYWAGFIAADGNIGKRSKSLSITQADQDPLKRFCKCIGHKGKISTRVRLNGSVENCVTIRSDDIIDDLKRNFNIVPNKTKMLEPPINLCDTHALAYIVGYLDGDGHIYTATDKRNGYCSLRFGILGTLAVTSWMQNILKNGTRVRIRNDCPSPLYQVLSSGKNAERVLTRLSLVPGIRYLRLERKWNKFIIFMKNKYK